MRSLSWLFVTVSALGGCAEEAPLRRPVRVLPPPVEISDREPEGACCLVGAIEAQSGDETTDETLRAYALSRGANYVVRDTFSVWREEDTPTVVVRARMFACARPGYSTAQ